MKFYGIIFTTFLIIFLSGISSALAANNTSESQSSLILTTDTAIVGSITPKTAEMDSPFSSSIIVMNNGPAPARDIRIDYYLVRNNGTNAEPVWIHQKTAEQIPAFYQDTVPFTIPLPGGIEPGFYSLYSTITSRTPDRNLTNNGYLSHQPIDIRRAIPSPGSGDPDLSMTIDSISFHETAPGYPFTINYTIYNKGTRDAGTFHVGFYLSEDQEIDPSDTRLWDETYYNAYEGMAEAGTSTDIVPSGLSPGDYYLGGIVDFTHMVQEDEEENNGALFSTPIRILDVNPPINETFLNQVTGYIAVKTNLYRTFKGLPNLSYDLSLGDIALAHSVDMAARGYFSHETPEGLNPSERAERGNYDIVRRLDEGTIRTGVAENIIKISSGYTIGEKFTGFVDPSDPEKVADIMMVEWISSPEHNKNLLDPDIDQIGVGIAYNGEFFYGTQDFY